jgi:hypothetical protein
MAIDLIRLSEKKRKIGRVFSEYRRHQLGSVVSPFTGTFLQFSAALLGGNGFT